MADHEHAVDHDDHNLTDHEYDGIREYDNPCPTWWHMIFFGTAVFSVLYFVFFHLGSRAGLSRTLTAAPSPRT